MGRTAHNAAGNVDGHTVDRRTLLKGGIALAGGFAGAGAGLFDSSFAGAQAPEPPATKPDKLVVRSWGDPWSTNIGNIPGKAFTAKTGIPVQFDLTDFDVMDTKVRLAVKAGERPPVDVVYTIGRSAYTASVQKLLVPLNPSIVTNFKYIVDAGKPQGSKSDYVLVYTYTTPLIYRTDKVSLKNGDSWEVMWDPKYAGKLFVTTNFDPYVLPLSRMLHLDPATSNLAPLWAKLRTLRPNIKVVGDDTPFINNMTSGEVWLGSALVGDAVALQQANVPVEWIVPKQGAVLTGDAMYVPKHLPSNVTYYAQMFINEVIDAQMQTAWTANVVTVPTNSKAKASSFMQSNEAFPFTNAQIKKYAIPEGLNLAARNADSWQASFTAAIQS
jgi:spermidine/putrescine-binding protein